MIDEEHPADEEPVPLPEPVEDPLEPAADFGEQDEVAQEEEWEEDVLEGGA